MYLVSRVNQVCWSQWYVQSPLLPPHDRCNENHIFFKEIMRHLGWRKVESKVWVLISWTKSFLKSSFTLYDSYNPLSTRLFVQQKMYEDYVCNSVLCFAHWTFNDGDSEMGILSSKSHSFGALEVIHDFLRRLIVCSFYLYSR